MTQDKGKLITLAIHTFDYANALKEQLERGGIEVQLHNVDLNHPVISTGVRVRIHECDLPLALKIIERPDSPLARRSSKQPVIIPIDFSEYSLNACMIGFDFAHSIGAKVVLLHSYIGANRSGSLPFDSEHLKIEYGTAKDNEKARAAKEKMENFKASINNAIERGEMRKVPFETVIKEGVPEDCIIDFAKKTDAVMVVMGTRGKHKKQADMVGSVTAEVLDAGKFPVFSVPESIALRHIGDIKRVVFLNSMCQQDLISFDAFTRLFNHNELKVSLVPVTEKRESKIEERNNAILEYCNKQYPGSQFSIVSFKESNFVNDFSDYVAENNIDLIIIPNRKRNIFARLFNPSLAHKMLFLSDTPLLVIPI